MKLNIKQKENKMNIDKFWNKYSTSIAFGSKIFKDGIYKNEYMTKKSFTEAIGEILSLPVETHVIPKIEEVELLRKIAREAKSVLDKNQLPLESMSLKNLLTDYIDKNWNEK